MHSVDLFGILGFVDVRAETALEWMWGCKMGTGYEQ